MARTRRMTMVIFNRCSIMKNVFKFFVPMAAAVIATLASCVKEDINKAPEANVLNITVEAIPEEIQGEPQAVSQVKTYINGNAILWGTGEYMKIGVNDGGESTTFANSADGSADSFNGQAVAQFNFSVSVSGSEFTYYGLYPASAAVASSNNNPVSYKVNLPSVQNATAASYDPKAYILVAQPESGKSVANNNINWQASFRRATALNKITLKNVPDGKSINRVKITAPAGTDLAGGRHIDLTTGLSSDIYGGTNMIEVKYDTPLSGANVDVWFTSWIMELGEGDKLTVVAYTTDKKSYTKEITIPSGRSIKFLEGNLNTTGVSLDGISPADVTELEDGDYLILAKNGDNYYAMKAEAESTRLAYETYTGSTSAYTEGSADLIWTVSQQADNSYTIANNSMYLGWSSGNTASLKAAGNDWTTTNYALEITWETDHYKVNVKADDTRILAKNNQSQYGFGFYTGSGYNSILFVPVDNREAVTLSFAASAIDKTTANYSGFTGQAVSATDSNDDDITGSITVEYEKESDSNNVVTSLDSSTGAIVLSGNTGSATIKATFDGNTTYAPATASYTINVTNAAEVGWVETALADITSSDVFVIVGNNGSNYAMNHTTLNNNGAPTATAVTISNNKLSSDPSAELRWNLVSDANGYMFYPDGVTNKWLNLIANNNGLRVSNTAANGKYWSLDASGYLKGTDTANATRYIGVYNSTDWRSYTGYGGNIANQTFKFYKYQDPRTNPGMTWSANSATASWDTGNTASGFSAPMLTPGNATGITYESTDTAVATVNSAGAVTIVGPGETTIKAIFAGDATYQAQTVSYVLTVTDNRETVATPVISPDASSTVPSGTEVTITCSTSGATIYYTLDNSAPDSNSSTYSGAITLTESKVVKAIAIKNGYKDSSVATANYTVGVVNTSTEADPYSAAEADALTGQLAANGTLADVYVSGIISEITTAYNSTYGNVSFNISADGLTTSTQFLIFRAAATSADDFKVGDAVEFKGTLKNYYANDTYTREMDAAATLIYQVHAPSFTPNGGSFTTSQSVTISADSGATIRYTDDGSTNPTASTGSVYSGALNLTATTTIKAIAIKDGHVTGVVSKTFTKGSGGGNVYSKYSGTLTEGDYIIYYDGKAMNNTISSDRLQYLEVTPSNDQITNPDASIVWHIAASGDYWTIYSANAGKYAASTGAKNKAALNSSGTDDKSLWSVSGTSTYDFVNKQNTTNNVNAYLRNNGTYGFACYASSTGGELTLYKKN